MEQVIQKISDMLSSSPWLAPLLALVGGVLTSLMPCSLSTVPLIIGCVGGGEAKGRRALALSLLFALGSAITFTALGVAASAVGHMLESAEAWMHLILGVILILMALQMWGVIDLIPSGGLASASRLHGAWGAFLAGMLAGVFSAHCAAPMTVALLALAADRGQPLFGVILLLLFSIGHGILSVVAGTSVGLVQKLTSSPGYEKASKIIRAVLGAIILLTALWLLWEAFSEGVLGHEHEAAQIVLRSL